MQGLSATRFGRKKEKIYLLPASQAAQNTDIQLLQYPKKLSDSLIPR